MGGIPTIAYVCSGTIVAETLPMIKAVTYLSCQDWVRGIGTAQPRPPPRKEPRP